MITCPACGCNIYQSSIKAHETYSDCLKALRTEQELLSQRTQRIIKFAETKLMQIEKELQKIYEAQSD